MADETTLDDEELDEEDSGPPIDLDAQLIRDFSFLTPEALQTPAQQLNAGDPFPAPAEIADDTPDELRRELGMIVPPPNGAATPPALAPPSTAKDDAPVESRGQERQSVPQPPPPQFLTPEALQQPVGPGMLEQILYAILSLDNAVRGLTSTLLTSQGASAGSFRPSDGEAPGAGQESEPVRATRTRRGRPRKEEASD